MVLDFNYDDYMRRSHDVNYPDFHNIMSSFDNQKLRRLRDRNVQRSGKSKFNTYTSAMSELKKRTTQLYYERIRRAQNKANDYAKDVFPPYELLVPEIIVDDWLSMVDWHKEYASRDHSSHQGLSAYIVQVLLGFGDDDKSALLYNGQRLLSYCAEMMLNSPKMAYLREWFPVRSPDFNGMSDVEKKNWAMNVFYQTAITSALFHDMGYPWQYIDRLSDHLNFIGISNICSLTCSGDDLKSELSGHLLSMPFYGYDQNILGEDVNNENVNISQLMEKAFRDTHGFPGAVSFLTLNKFIRKDLDSTDIDEVTNELIKEWASLGIMMHDMKDLYQKYSCFKLSFDVDPLSCIVSIADVLEEFERPSASFSEEGGNSKIILNYDCQCVGTQLETGSKVFTVKYLYDGVVSPSVKTWKKKEITEYFDLTNGFIDLSIFNYEDCDCETETKP